MKRNHLSVMLAVMVALLITVNTPQSTRAQQGQPLVPVVYLPTILNNYDPLAGQRVVNAPYVNDSDIVNNEMDAMSVFWFGQIAPNTNYTDVRVAYSDTALEIFTNTIDQWLWYNEQSTGANLENYDSVTLTLQTDTAAPGAPSTNSYRIVSQLHQWQTQDNYTAFYRGNGSAWVQKAVNFTAATGWRGDGLNGAVGKGWSDDIRIPYASLGLSSAPAAGTTWRIGVRIHDRDSDTGAMLPDTFWPNNNAANSPYTWSYIRFGLPIFTSTTVSSPQTVHIFQGNPGGDQVPDAEVGGGTTCSDSSGDFFSKTGNANYAGAKQVNIQNQSDVSDFPCFSKYYVTFPLNSIPAGKIIQSAELVMHQFGGSGGPGDTKYTSFVQVSTIANDWNENTITWNNAPLPLQNLTSTRIQVFQPNPINWNNLNSYQWDVSQAAIDALNKGAPLRLALYSPASAMHSGKYFVSSDDGWDTWNLPTLVVTYGSR